MSEPAATDPANPDVAAVWFDLGSRARHALAEFNHQAREDKSLTGLLAEATDQVQRRLVGETNVAHGPRWDWDPMFWVEVFARVLPSTLAWHRDHGVEEEVSRATLADVGRHAAIYERRLGRPGVYGPRWLIHHLTAQIFALGRLQFARETLWWAQLDIDGAGFPLRHGQPALGVHIPEGSPFDAASIDHSLGRARSWFRRHLPEENFEIATCTSWLLDDQLVAWVGPNSNISGFQARWACLPGGIDGDEDVRGFVFDDREPSSVPEPSHLQAAILRHWTEGGHCQLRSGWLELP